MHSSARGIGVAAILGCLLSAALAWPAVAAATTATSGGNATHGQPRLFAATGTVQVAFTPGDPVDDILIGVIGQARQQVLVQAFSFTHKAIARALVDAHRRGVRVEVLADDRQDRLLEDRKIAGSTKGRRILALVMADWRRSRLARSATRWANR